MVHIDALKSDTHIYEYEPHPHWKFSDKVSKCEDEIKIGRNVWLTSSTHAWECQLMSYC